MRTQLPPKHTGRITRVVLLALMALNAVRAADPLATQILSATGVTAGLAVHVGCGDGATTVDLSSGGRLLVQGLALTDANTDAARAAVRAAGLYGLVTIHRPLMVNPLPYAENMVNLLVADLDALGSAAPPEAEIERVLAPNGVSYVKKNGAWNKTVKAMPPHMDEWTHFYYDAGGNCQSKDELVAPSNGLKWIAGITFGPKMGSDTYSGYRLHNGKAVYDAHKDHMSPRYFPAPGGKVVELNARDAFNGLLTWHIEMDRIERRFNTVTCDGKLFTCTGFDQFVTARDIETGALVKTYDQGLKHERIDNKEQLDIAYFNGLLVQTQNHDLVVLDAATGAVVWRYAAPDSIRLFWPTVSAQHNLLFVVENKIGTHVGYSRWPVVDVEAVTAFDLTHGDVRWRNTDAGGQGNNPLDPTNAGGRSPMRDFHIGQLMVHGDNLAFGAGNALAGPPGGWAACLGNLSISTGQLKWKTMWPEPFYHQSPIPWNFFIHAGDIYSAGPYSFNGFRLEEGTWIGSDPGERLMPVYRHSMNQRCTRGYSTPNYAITGFNQFFNVKDSLYTFTSITRSQCAMGGLPGYGMVYHTANGCLGCMRNQLRGYMALCSYPLETPADDSRRLITSGPSSTPVTGGDFMDLATPLSYDWVNTTFYDHIDTAAQTAGSLTLVKGIHNHRLDALEGGAVKWSFTAGARISGTPLVKGNKVYFGSHDGFVYCLDLADGAPQWRFMAAPTGRQIVAHGQLESAWPVYNVALAGNGQLCFAAGRHSETDGGIWVYGVNPASGALSWKVRIYQGHRTVSFSTKNESRVSPYSALDSLHEPKGLVATSDGLRVGNTAVIDPDNPQGIIGDLWDLTGGVSTMLENLREVSPGAWEAIRLTCNSFALRSRGHVDLTLYDTRGRKLEVVFQGLREAGRHRIGLEDMRRGAGTYLLRMVATDAAGKKSFATAKVTLP